MFRSVVKYAFSGSVRAFQVAPVRHMSVMRQPSPLSLIRGPQTSSSTILQRISSPTITEVIIPNLTAAFQQLRFASRGNRRGGNRGNTYQPSTIKRKRRLGFLARMKTRNGRKIVKRRKLKGRWYLTH